jgi:hypothetical protein
MDGAGKARERLGEGGIGAEVLARQTLMHELKEGLGIRAVFHQQSPKRGAVAVAETATEALGFFRGNLEEFFDVTLDAVVHFIHQPGLGRIKRQIQIEKNVSYHINTKRFVKAVMGPLYAPGVGVTTRIRRRFPFVVLLAAKVI